jgi:hypothetical protein
MSPLIRFTSWMAAIGTHGAASNAKRAVEEREAAEAAVDALSIRLAATVPRSNDPRSNDTAPSRVA